MPSQRTLATVLGSILSFALVSQVLVPGQATADDLRSQAQQAAISQVGTAGFALLATDDDPWH